MSNFDHLNHSSLLLMIHPFDSINPTVLPEPCELPELELDGFRLSTAFPIFAAEISSAVVDFEFAPPMKYPSIGPGSRLLGVFGPDKPGDFGGTLTEATLPSVRER